MMRRSQLGQASRVLLGFAVFAAAVGVWEVWARAHSSFLLPTPAAVVKRAAHVWPTSAFLTDVEASLGRLAVGYAVGAGLGIVLGLVMGAWRPVRRTLGPTVELLRATPPIAIVPVAILVFGFANEMQISIIAFGVVFPVLIYTLDGVRAVSPEARDVAVLLRLSWLDRILRVYLPSALPSIFAGLRVALPIGLVMVVVSELVGGHDGIGYYILFQQSLFNAPDLYGGILFLGLLALALNAAFLLVERFVLRWHYGAAGELAR
jgi:ABC-type nitrate/sulfonate/bicarbonate transport system permease component